MADYIYRLMNDRKKIPKDNERREPYWFPSSLSVSVGNNLIALSTTIPRDISHLSDNRLILSFVVG